MSYPDSSSTRPEWLKTVGNGVNELDADRLLLESDLYKYWKPATVSRERKVSQSTWFDYRHLHPVLRSHLFLHEYGLAYGRAYQRFYDHAPSDRRRLKPGLGYAKRLYARKPRMIASILSRMHLVDETGLPYDVFFDGAFQNMMQKRQFSSVWNQKGGLKGFDLPPINIMVDGETVLEAQQMFEKRNLHRMRLALHPHYGAESWTGGRWQRDYADYVLGTARARRGDVKHVLARLAYDKKAVREQEIARSFGLDMVRDIRKIRDTSHL